jgi:hypothetical protein
VVTVPELSGSLSPSSYRTTEQWAVYMPHNSQAGCVGIYFPETSSFV